MFTPKFEGTTLLLSAEVADDERRLFGPLFYSAGGASVVCPGPRSGLTRARGKVVGTLRRAVRPGAPG